MYTKYAHLISNKMLLVDLIKWMPLPSDTNARSSQVFTSSNTTTNDQSGCYYRWLRLDVQKARIANVCKAKRVKLDYLYASCNVIMLIRVQSCSLAIKGVPCITKEKDDLNINKLISKI